METKLRHKIIAWVLTICLSVTLIPNIGHANEKNAENEKSEKKISQEEVTEENVIEKTETTTTYDLGGGEEMLVFHGGEVRYKDEFGKLVDYDPSLVSILEGEKTKQKESLNEYAYKNKQGDKKLYMPEFLSEQTPIILENYSYKIELTPSSRTIEESGLDNHDVKIESEMVSTIYEDEAKMPINAVYGAENKPAVFKYTSGESGIKETIILNEKPESNVFEYKLNTGGLRAKKNVTNEGITIYDEKSEDIVAYIAPPWMNDDSGKAYSEDITYDLKPDGEAEGSYILTMTVDRGYLDDKARKYPVTIDPTTTWTGSSKVRDVYVINGTYKNTNFYESGTVVMPAGKNSTGIHETYIQFVNLKSAISGKNVTAATFSAYEVSGGANGQKVGAFKVTGSWSPSTLTYSNKPACASSAMSSVTTQPAAVEHKFNVASYVKGVADGTAADAGIALKNITTSPSYAVFFGSRHSTTSYKPKLTVTYSDTPPAATSAKVSPEYVKDSTLAKLTFTGLPASSLKRVEYRITAYDDIAGKEGAVVKEFGESTAITSGDALPALDSGCYKVYVRGVNSAGTSGAAVSAGIIHVDKTTPALEAVSLKNSAGTVINGKWAGETNPVIGFSGISDSHITSSCISYAIAPKGIEPAAADFKTPADISMSSGQPYSGTFRLAAGDRSISSGDYTIHVKVTDQAGNSRIKRLSYKKDTEDPEGSIILTDLITGNEVTRIYKPVNIEVGVSGTGSDIAESSLKLYKAVTDNTGKVTGVDNSTEKVITKDFTLSENIVMDTIDICDSYGKYRLILHLKDSVGRTKEITKDFEVTYTLPAPDKVQIVHSKGGEAKMVWGFTYTPQQKIKLGSIEGKFSGESSFKTLVPAGENGTLPFDGSANITVPNTEGTWDVIVRGKAKSGHVGEEITVKCVVDKTTPVVKDILFNQCYLQGTVTDDNLKEWRVYAKEKTATGYGKEPISRGNNKVQNYLIAFVDMGKAPFEPGKEYTLKIVAEDKAGNTTQKTVDVTVPTDNTIPKLIEAQLKIDKGDSNTPSERTFIYGTDRNELSVVGNETGVEWYIANRKSSPALKDSNGNALYNEMGWWDVLALKKENNGTRKYSVPVMENGYKSELSFTPEEISSNTGTKSFYSNDPVVSFRIKDTEGTATYQVKANTTNEGKYVTVEPGKTYYITDITKESAFANSFDVKVTAADGHTVNDCNAVLFADTAVNEYFIYSNVEDFAPKRLSVEDKINYKTYLKWDIPDNLPDTVSYEVYRSTSEDFFPDESTLVASDIKAGYFTEINAQHGKEFYYKVCAVKKYTDPLGMNFESRSSFTEVTAGRATDQNESVKRLGIKEFWEFAEFNTPNGNGYIEKSSGNFVYQQKDAELPNEDFNVELTRTYNSQSSSRGTFGLGWSHDYDIELINVSEDNALDFTHVVLKDGNGTIYHFTRGSEDEHFISSFGTYVNLMAEKTEKEKTVVVAANGANNSITLKYQFLLYTKDGLKYYFNSGGQLILMEENNGKFVIFEHEAKKGVLSSMRTNNNVTLEFTYYDGKNGSDPLTVKEIKMPDGSKVTYEYTRPFMSSDRLLTKVTEVADGESIEYEYEYDRPLLSSQPRNLTLIKEPQNGSKYKISYDFENDSVSEAVYPNGEKFTFDYAADNTYTITKKYSDGQAVIGEKDFFDRVYGRCEKSIRGVDDISKLEGTDESGFDVTAYKYKDNQKTATVSTAQYREINSDGYIVEKSGVKENKVSYSGDDPVKEIEDDGTISEYTYYTKEDGENLEDLIKTVKETNGDGKVTSYKKYSYDTAGNVTETIDYVEGTKITNTYYTEGNFKGELKSMQESLLTVTDTHEITSESVKSTSQYSYEYGENGSKTDTCTQTVPKADGTNEVVTTSQTYDVMGRLVKDIDSRGYQTISTYDGFGRETAVTYKYTDSDQLKSNTAKTYDKNGMVTYEKLEDGIEKWYTYDNMGQVTSIRVKKGENYDETINTTYRYQDVEIYQGKGNETVRVKNAYVTKEAYADGTVISETYEDHKGNVVRTYQNGLYTDMTYDSQGEMITRWLMGQTLSGTEGLLELYIYDDKGNLTATVTDPGYDTGTNTTGYKVTDDSVVTKSSYDSDGNTITQTDALGNITRYAYDKTGNLISVTQPDEVKYEYQYDVKNDNFTTKDVVMEPRAVKTGDAVTNMTSKSIVVKDSSDRTIKVEDLGTGETDGTSISTSYEYDIRDNLIKATEKNGNYKAYTYDVRNRLTAIDYYENKDGSAVKTLRTEFTYDNSDNMTSMTDKKVTAETAEIYRYTEYGYDGFNRLISVAECDTSVMPTKAEINASRISYGYDGKDRLISIDYPDCSLGVEGLRFTYNVHGWLTEVKGVKKGGGERTVREYSYTDDGKVSQMTDYTDFTEGLTGKGKWIKRTYTYDKLDRPVSIAYTDNMSGSSETVKEAHTYEYDKNNNIITEDVVDKYGATNSSDYGELRDYRYDVNNRLIESGLMKRTAEDELSAREAHYYTYDAAGNKTSELAERQKATRTETIFDKQYSYNEFNQLTAVTGDNFDEGVQINKNYSYDTNGNQIKEADSITGRETLYVYDADNRLKTAVGKTGSSVEYTQENQYNGFGQRVEKKEGAEVTDYFYDGTAVLYTKDKDSAVTSFNLIGAEDNILATARPGSEGATEFYTYTKDIRESTMNLIGADGTAQVSYDYDDFGETTVYDKNKEKPFYNEICYTAGVYDKTTGLYNLNARYYDPESGSFLTQDTYRGSRSRTETLNLYTYCAGNPISYSDTSGHWIGSVIGAAMGAYDGYKYAKKKNLKGWRKGAAILGGTALGAVNPFKLYKAGKTGYKAYKATKYGKKAASTYKKAKAGKKAKSKPKVTTVTKKSTKTKSKPKVTKSAVKTAKKETKRVKAACFTAGTKIHTKDGFKNIESIKAGDYVWSENPETHEKALKKVNKIFVREKDSIIRLSINGEIIETTDEHPFYVEGQGFTEAKNLNAGDEVRTADGATAEVENVETVKLDKPVKVYNFEVEDFHTYYVSEQTVLVHNTCAVTTKKWSTASSIISETRYSPVNPGPLSQKIANTFTGGSYTERILAEDTVMYRVHGGKASKVGSYLSRTLQNGGLQSQMDLALKPEWGNTAEYVTKVIVPKGTKIYEGNAAPQNITDSMGNVIGILPGGGNQVYIPTVSSRWFK